MPSAYVSREQRGARESPRAGSLPRRGRGVSRDAPGRGERVAGEPARRRGDRPVVEIEPGEVAGLVSHLHESGLKRESIRKTIATLAMVFDHAERVPNPARDKRVRLPQEDRAEVNPPTAAHVLAVRRLLPTRYRLPLLVLDATGMRVSVFAGFGADRLRTAIMRACKAAGVPAFSPHDLRHRRASLWHLSGSRPWKRPHGSATRRRSTYGRTRTSSSTGPRSTTRRVRMVIRR